MSSDTISSAICDSSLLDLGTWDDDARKVLQDWVRSQDFEERRLKSSRLIPYLIERRLGDQITDDGRVRARNLAESLIHLEDLLITARSGIGKKFYRDHLNHMLRVALIANAIATRSGKLSQSGQIDQLVLACLFHDMAYPLAQSRVIIEESIAAMESSYQSLNFPRLTYAYAMGKVAKLLDELARPPDLSIVDIGYYLDNFAHSVVGGIEFLDYVRTPEMFRGVLEAIVLHDSQFSSEVEFARSPLLAFLIIADELQDWGRPVAFQEEAVIPEIGNMRITEQGFSGEFDYRRESPLSPFRQGASKFSNLRRLNLAGSGLTINIRLILPDYEIAELHGLEKALLKLYSPELRNSLNLSGDFGQEWYVERYYGTRISQGTHTALMKAITDGNLTTPSPLSKFVAYVNSVRAELILVQQSIGCPKALVLRAVDGHRFDFIVEGQQETKVRVLGSGSSDWRGTAEFLADELRIFNRLCTPSKQTTEEGSYVPPLGDFFPPPSKVLERLRLLGFQESEISFVNKLRTVRKAMSQGGFYMVSADVDE